MKMAINELTSLCRGALEGAGYVQGDYEDAAEAAVWLQAIGFDGVEALNGLFERGGPELYAVRGVSSNGQIEEEGEFAPSESLMGCLLVFELAWNRATRAGLGVVEVSGALSPRLALYGLQMMSARGRRFDLSWTDAAGRHTATTTGLAEHPHYLGCTRERDMQTEALTVCCFAADPLDAAVATISEHDHGAMDPSELDARYRDAVWRGLDMELAQIERLSSWKSRVLVAESLTSRECGAGGADDGF